MTSIVCFQTAILCGALKLLKASKFKSDPVLTSGLFYLAKKWPSLFTKKAVFNALCSLLKKETQTLCKTKITLTNAVLITNILYFTYRDVEHWPEIFLRVTYVCIFWYKMLIDGAKLCNFSYSCTSMMLWDNVFG